MSTPGKAVLIAILAIVGIYLAVHLLAFVLQWAVIAAVVVGVLYVVGRILGVPALGGSRRKSLP